MPRLDDRSASEDGRRRRSWGGDLRALVRRRTDHVYGRWVLKFGADVLLAAAAFALAFSLRFLDAPGGIPERYWTMLTGTIAFATAPAAWP